MSSDRIHCDGGRVFIIHDIAQICRKVGAVHGNGEKTLYRVRARYQNLRHGKYSTGRAVREGGVISYTGYTKFVIVRGRDQNFIALNADTVIDHVDQACGPYYCVRFVAAIQARALTAREDNADARVQSPAPRRDCSEAGTRVSDAHKDKAR